MSAFFTADFAAIEAHDSIGRNEANSVQPVGCNPGGGLPDHDLSDDMFGTASPPGDPQLNLAPLETGWVSADVDASFFPAPANGRVGLRALFTDTADGRFAMDFISPMIEATARTMVTSFYGWPLGDENNGFGIGLADGDDLPERLPHSIPMPDGRQKLPGRCPQHRGVAALFGFQADYLTGGDVEIAATGRLLSDRQG